MKVAIVHHHFDSGGVTSVVLGHLLGLSQLAPSLRPQQLLLLHGGRAHAMQQQVLDAFAAEMPVQQAAIWELEYDERRELVGSTYSRRGTFAAKETEQAGRALCEAIEKELVAAKFDKNETVIHFHNPTLGKSVALPVAVRNLSERGWAMLLQIHDFAEDLRPRNYEALIRASGATSPGQLSGWLYPSGPATHYATLSNRDALILADRVVTKDRVHLIPNPITTSKITSLSTTDDAGEDEFANQRQSRKKINNIFHVDPQSKYLLYPVRGIQRKNLGEILLLSSLCGPAVTFSITLPPTTEIEKANWRRWYNWSRDLRLPVVFGSGLHSGVSFADNRAAADAIVTTSVAEGFGLVYLESWLNRRAVIGRDLPGVTSDFRDHGLTLDLLYNKLFVPLTKKDKQLIKRDMINAHKKAWWALPAPFQPTPFEFVESYFDEVDFAELTPQWQAKILINCARDAGYADECRKQNSEALSVLDSEIDRHLIEQNVRAVTSGYSPAKIAERLVSVYQTLLQQERRLDISERQGASVAESLAKVSKHFAVRTETPVIDNPFERLTWPLSPIPTGVAEQLSPMPGIKAVVFDVYGTLVISGSGEVGTADQVLRTQAMAEALLAVELTISCGVEAAVLRLHELIGAQQDRRRQQGVEYPEVNIVDVWQAWLDELVPDWQIVDRVAREVSAPLHQRLAEEFEARANRCFVMPGAEAVLQSLTERGIKLGIVSNAQFFTEKMLSAAFGCNFWEQGFEQDLCLFSYRFGHGKPSTLLYSRLAEGLARHSIAASETLFVGNDMLNDVTAASQCQLKTALFAGDQRSLRVREGDRRVSGVHPDLVLTRLSQLLDVISPSQLSNATKE